MSGPVRDAAIQPRLVLVLLILLFFTDDMRVSLTPTSYIISLGVVLCAMLVFGFEWGWSFG